MILLVFEIVAIIVLLASLVSLTQIDKQYDKCRKEREREMRIFNQLLTVATEEATKGLDISWFTQFDNRRIVTKGDLAKNTAEEIIAVLKKENDV